MSSKGGKKINKTMKPASFKDRTVVPDVPYGEEDSQAEGLLNYQAHKRRVNEQKGKTLEEIRRGRSE
jgi:hypothetical protein